MTDDWYYDPKDQFNIEEEEEEEEDIDIGICMGCGSYGRAGFYCSRTEMCGEYL